MKPLLMLLVSSSILILFTQCATSDISERRVYRSSIPVPTRSLVQDHAEGLIQANPEVSHSTAYSIAERRLGAPDKPSKREIKQQAARQEFRDDLANVLGEP